MGFFSWNCKGCGKSIKAPYDLPASLDWHNTAVVLLSNGTRIIGEYDGYGRLGGWDYGDSSGEEPEMWHQRCWEGAGCPDYTGASRHAEDQGYFYDVETPTRGDYPEDMQEVGDALDLFNEEGELRDLDDLMP